MLKYIKYSEDLSISFINLEKRKDRLAGVNKNLLDMGFDTGKINHFLAIEHEYGEVGCAKSHISLCQSLISQKNTKYHLIFEDDFRFKIPVHNILELIHLLENQQINFDFLHLYGEWPVAIAQNQIIFGDKLLNVFKILNSQTTACYLVPNYFLESLIEYFSHCLNKLNNSLHLIKETNVENYFVSSRKQDPTFRVFTANNYSIDQFWRNLMLEKSFIGINLEIGQLDGSKSDIISSDGAKDPDRLIKKISDLK